MVKIFKIILSIALTTSFYCTKVQASFNEKEEVLYTKACTLFNLPPEEKQREEFILRIFKDPNITVYDLSLTDLKDEDAINILNGLFEREIDAEQNETATTDLKLIDLSSENFTRSGVERLLDGFQHGREEKAKKIYPDVRGTILKVSSEVNVTEDLLSKWHRSFPSVFAGGLRIVE